MRLVGKDEPLESILRPSLSVAFVGRLFIADAASEGFINVAASSFIRLIICWDFSRFASHRECGGRCCSVRWCRADGWSVERLAEMTATDLLPVRLLVMAAPNPCSGIPPESNGAHKEARKRILNRPRRLKGSIRIARKRWQRFDWGLSWGEPTRNISPTSRII